MKQITITATKARQDFFNLINLARDGAEIVITKTGTSAGVILKREPKRSNKDEIEKNRKLFKKTFGALKSEGYKPDEFEIAKKKFASVYKKKHGIK